MAARTDTIRISPSLSTSKYPPRLAGPAPARAGGARPVRLGGRSQARVRARPNMRGGGRGGVRPQLLRVYSRLGRGRRVSLWSKSAPCLSRRASPRRPFLALRIPVSRARYSRRLRLAGSRPARAVPGGPAGREVSRPREIWISPLGHREARW